MPLLRGLRLDAGGYLAQVSGRSCVFTNAEWYGGPYMTYAARRTSRLS